MAPKLRELDIQTTEIKEKYENTMGRLAKEQQLKEEANNALAVEQKKVILSLVAIFFRQDWHRSQMLTLFSCR